MAQGFKTAFPTFEFGKLPAAWTQATAPTAIMTEWLAMQQKLFALTAKFGQEAAAMMDADFKLASEVMRRLVMTTTPDEFAATQRDMFELMSSKYFEQWLKLGDEFKTLFTETGTKALAKSAEAKPVEVQKKAA